MGENFLVRCQLHGCYYHIKVCVEFIKLLIKIFEAGFPIL